MGIGGGGPKHYGRCVYENIEENDKSYNFPNHSEKSIQKCGKTYTLHGCGP